MKSFHTIYREFNIPDSPMADLGNISGKGNGSIKGFWGELHPNSKTTLLQMGAAKDSLSKRPTNVFSFVSAGYLAGC